MDSSRMDLLDFLTDEELIQFFHCKKTEMSCMEEPNTFLNQLRDHNLVPEKLYQKVINMRSEKQRQKAVYDILDRLENKQGQKCVKLFWRCVFQDHMLQKYPSLRSLRNSILDGSFRICEKLPDAEEPSSSKEVESERKKQEQKKKATKRKKSDEEKDEEEPGTSSVPLQKKPAMKPTFSPQKRAELPVSCGNKKGTLYPDKLARGEKCILSQDVWYTPNEFERFSGRDKSKNWKLSIRHQNVPLLKLIEKGQLQCPHSHRSGPQKRVTFSPVCEESSSSQSSVDTDQSSEGSGERIEEEDTEQEEQVKEEFQALVLPVSCGSVSGMLHKSRFSGSSSKSIRTDECWFTPEEFVKQEFNQTERHWKKDILCHGKTLHYLMRKNILKVHQPLCLCRLCCPENKDQDNDDVCYICNSAGRLVCCDKCPRAFHHHCHLPALQDTLGDKWICTYCVLKSNDRLWIQMSREDALKSSVSENIMRCEYLLLFLYKSDLRHVLSDNPSHREERNSSVISKPMWLNKVKAKLQKKTYRTVRQFVRDIKLIFKTCQTFNRDNKYRRMGLNMKKKFEEEFNTVFKIQ